MVIHDLKQPCTRCEGRGRLPGLEKMGMPQINFTGTCPACQGRGFTLTQLGEEVLEWLKPFVLDWLKAEQQGGPGLSSAAKPGTLPSSRPTVAGAATRAPAAQLAPAKPKDAPEPGQ